MNEKKPDRDPDEEAEEARVARDRQDFLDEIERDKLHNRIVRLMRERTAAKKRGDEQQVAALVAEIERLRQESLDRFGY